MIDHKQLQNVEYFSHVGSLITRDATRTSEVISFHQQTELKFKEETSIVLHLENSVVWY
jgi:hypothetical protein